MLTKQWIREKKLEAVARRSSVQKLFLKMLQNAQENTCVGVCFSLKMQAYFIEKDTPTQVFSCEFCDIFKHIFFNKHLRATAS